MLVVVLFVRQCCGCPSEIVSRIFQLVQFECLCSSGCFSSSCVIAFDAQFCSHSSPACV